MKLVAHALAALLLVSAPVNAQECLRSGAIAEPDSLVVGDTLTVYSELYNGQREELSVRVAGFMPHPAYRGETLILVDMLDNNPVIAGESGSPVCRADALVGALAYRIGDFPQRLALGGITPMRAITDQRSAIGSKRPLTPFSGTAAFIPSATIAGAELPIAGLGAFSLLSAAPPAAAPPVAVYGGESATMMLARGDFQIGATCTITARISDTHVSMCGHPVLNHGPVQLPVYRSLVSTSFLSHRESFKLIDEIGAPIGVADYDGSFGVEIRTGEIPDSIMIPVTLRAHTPHGQWNFAFDVMRFNDIYPYHLMKTGIAYLSERLWRGYSTDATARLTANVYLRGAPQPVTLRSEALMAPELFGDGSSFKTPWNAVLKPFQDQLYDIYRNPYGFEIERVDVSLDIREVRTYSTVSLSSLEMSVGDLVTEDPMLGAGDSLFVSLTLKSDGEHPLFWTRTVAFSADSLATFAGMDLVRDTAPADTTPADSATADSASESTSMPSGKLHMYVRSGAELAVAPALPQTHVGPDAYVDHLRKQYRDPRELFIQFVYEPPSEIECSQVQHGTDKWTQHIREPEPACATERTTHVLTIPLGRTPGDKPSSIEESRKIKMK